MDMSQIKLTLTALVIGVVLGMTIPGSGIAAMPEVINYQGYLADQQGQPINGTVDITFRLYTTESGASLVWEETQSLTLDQGIIDTTLGALTPLNFQDFETPLFLGVQIGSDSEMTPRRPLALTGYAIKADDAYTVGGVSASNLDQSAHVSDITTNPHQVTADQVGALSATAIDNHAAIEDAHHGKTESFTELTDEIADAQIPTEITRDTELAIHSGNTTNPHAVTPAQIGAATTADIIPSVLANDGTGSGLDADLLDGSDSTAFASSTHNHDSYHVNITGDTMTGTLNLPADGLVVGTDQLVLSGGQVGIGTASPIDGLHLKDTHVWGSALRLDASDLTGGQWWRIESTSDSHAEGGGKFLIRDTVAPYAFAITSNGNVGIGTTSPASSLDVIGTVTASTFVGDGSGLTNIPAGALGTTIESTEITDGEIVNADISATAAIAASKIADGSSSGLDADLLDGQDSADFAAAAHAHDGTDIDTGTVAEARIDPLLARDTEIIPTLLAGDGAGSNLDADLLDGNDSTAFATSGHTHDPDYVNTTGDTMTGALTAPNLTATTSMSIPGHNVQTATNVGNTFLGLNTGNVSMTGGSNVAMGYNALQSNTTGGQNVAIGSQALRYNTTGINNTAMGDSALRLNTTGNQNIAMGHAALGTNTDGNANTAIGMTALSQNTSGSSNSAVGESALRNNTSGTRNMAMGNLALNSNSIGSRNVAMGHSALYSNTTANFNSAVGDSALYANTTGHHNTAIGTDALYANTTASYNTAIGDSALHSNTTADYNTAMGYSALYSNTTGAGNAAVGYMALNDNTTGGGNTAMGTVALFSNTTGSNNTALGRFALYFNTEGHSNTAIGHLALYENTTAYNNTAVGSKSLQHTTGSGNTATGSLALYENTTGSDNTALGVEALRLNTTGNNNIVVGYEAGYHNNGSGNVFLGYQAGYNETGSNILHIANNSTSTLIYGDFAAERVGIGTTTPTTALDVNGGIYSEVGTLTGRGVSASATGSSGRALEGIATGGSSMGVFGAGGQYDFYAGGVGTNYGPFTGGHEVKLSEEITYDTKAGMIVSVTGEAQARFANDGSVSLSSTLPTVKLSNKKNDKAVFGVLVAETPLPEGHWYQGTIGERFATVNALGEGRVWVSNIDGDIEAGDYITTSSIPGYGQKQADDLLHSYTLGKAIESVEWDMVVETVEYNGQLHKVYLIAVVYTSG